MSGRSGEESTRWGPAETAKYRELVKSGKIDIDAVDPKSVRKVWEKYWPQRKLETFRLNYRKTAADLRVERESGGARARFAAGGGRFVFFVHFTFLMLVLTFSFFPFSIKDDDDDDEDDEDYKDYDNNDDNTDSEEEEEEDNVDNDEDDNNIKMPPKLLVKKPPSKSKTPPKKSVATVADITAAVSGKLKITAAVPFSLATRDAFMMVKYYTHKFIDFVEVEFWITGMLPPTGYISRLVKDGMAMMFKRSIPTFFCESKRMKAKLGDNYHANDTRVIAHDNVVQQIRRHISEENQGFHFGSDDEAQIVPLNVRCIGHVKMREHCQKVHELVAGLSTHYQYATIITCTAKVMEQRSAQKKIARRSFMDEADMQLSEESDSDASIAQEGIEDEDL
jgi:hypothetical protein